MEALDLINAEFAHERHLLVALDAFDENLVAAIADQADYVLEHRPAPWQAAVMKERAIDLDGVEIDQAKPRQTGKASPEVIEPNLDSQQLGR